MVIEHDGNVGIGTTTPAATAHIIQTSTTQPSFRVERDLASGSTDDVVCAIIQENSGDDQVALYIRQDGTGNLITAKDGATTSFAVADGGDVTITGDLIMADGKGIDFSASTDDASPAVEILDDYEEGTYTPTIVGASGGNFVTSTYTTASYVKIGSLCHVKGYINVSSDNSASGTLRISLPFTSSNTAEDSESCVSPFVIRGHAGTHATGLLAVITSGNSYFSILSVAEDGTGTWVDETGVDDAWNFYLGITYQTA